MGNKFFGDMDLSRHLRSTALVFFILIAIIQTSHSRYHGKRHKRQNGAHMYLPESFIVPNGEGELSEWSEWSTPSDCSRSCGGGVSFQTRECLRISSNGARQCRGGSRKYFSCNTQDCPEEEPDFRAQQCTRFNSVPFDGVHYEWVPYTNAPNPCELNCMPRGERFYYRHKAKVIDGTRCNDKTLDICVDGECQPVGCDMMLGSKAREDKCRKCAGDGSSCKTISGVFDTNNLAAGYNDILLIPTGATNIVLKEAAPSNNYLACRNLTGHYYLNGNWRIDFPRPMHFAGSWWHYQRKPTGFAAPDHLTCSGPTTESIYIVMLIQDRNVGVHYEYSIPEAVTKTFPDTYSWTHMEYGACSVTCGGGIQARNVTCNNRLTLEKVDESLCDSNIKPNETQACGIDECDPYWVESEWGKCSKGCGQDGYQNRTVYCERISSNGVASVVEDSVCLKYAGNKPANTQECNRDFDNCPKYHIGPWAPCNQLCGEGKRSRTITCYKIENGKKIVLSNDECSEKKPDTEESCMLTPCEGVDWIISQWSGCNKCGQNKETRTAICGSKNGKVYDEKFCSQPKPDLMRPCNPPKCKSQWFTSQWSECSTKCGKGIRSRIVLCGEFDGITVSPASDDKECNALERPNSEELCETEDNACSGEWFTGPWGECSKTCGGGQRTREVFCMANGTKTSTCDESKIEFGSESCNSHRCTDDETIPMDISSRFLDSDEESGEDCEEDYDQNFEIELIPQNTEKNDILLGLGIEMDKSATKLSPLIMDDLMLSDAPSYDDDLTTDSTSEISVSTTFEGSGEKMYTNPGSTASITEGSGEDNDDQYTTSERFSRTEDEFSSPDTTEITDVTGTDITNSPSTDASHSTQPDTTFITEELITLLSTSVETTTYTEESSISTGASSDAQSSTTSSIDEASSSDIIYSSSSNSAQTETSTEQGLNESSSYNSLVTSTTIFDSSDTTADSSTETTSDGSTRITSDSSDSNTETTLGGNTEITSSGSTELTSDLNTETTEESTTKSTSENSSEITSESSTEITPESSTEITSESSTEITSESSTEITSESSTEITSESSVETSSEGSTDTTTEFSTETTLESSTYTTLDSSTETELETSSESTKDSSTDTTLESVTDTTEMSLTEEDTEANTDSSSTEHDSTYQTSLDDNTTTVVSTETDLDGTTEENSDYSSDSTLKYSTEKYLSTTDVSELDTTTLFTTIDISSSSSDTSESEVDASSEFTSIKPISTDETSSTDSTTVTKDISSTLVDSTLDTTESTKSSTLATTDINQSSTLEANDKSSTSYDTTSAYDVTSSIDMRSTDKTDNLQSSLAVDTSTVDIWSSEPSQDRDIATTPNTLKAALDRELKPRKCKLKKRRKGNCIYSKFGCCPDKKTSAKGPFGLGCPIIKTCLDSEFGCCPDGLSPAQGHDKKGCPVSTCKETLFGCCSDNFTPAAGDDYEGCPEPTTQSPTTTETLEEETTETTVSSSSLSDTTESYSQITDVTDATDATDATGITDVTDLTKEDYTTVIPDKEIHISCSSNKFGCCPDGKTSAKGENFKGCELIDEKDCSKTLYGCCRDGKTSARGPNEEGCASCTQEPYGCCQDGVTPAHGSMGEGCCLKSQFGCCPDNINAARGPNFQDCDCKYTPYGCCPDNTTAARGRNNEGCSCDTSLFGCCPDKLTPAKGDRFSGCPCHTMQFGCCPDGVTLPQGPHHYGCHCTQTQYKCCLDEKTAAKGPNYEGCSCAESKFGCCPDGVTEAQGNKFEGCAVLPESPQKACGLPKETGNCSNFSIQYFFDTSYGACARFWYGGCGGNGNRFETEIECKNTCQEYKGKDTCLLPKSAGPCPSFQKKWYFNSDRSRCEEFNYGGCYGTSNRFDSLEECKAQCSIEEILPPCEQPADHGPCQGNFDRWYYDNETDVCRQFVYGGCKGNKNNYITEHACNYHCRQPGVHKDLCALPKESGSCGGNHARWHFSENDQACLPFYYTGCGGNKNNFMSVESCEEHCPKKIAKDICEIPAEVGECQNYTPRWYWDTKDGRCRQFYYGGCGGNGNNFGEEQECLQRCEKREKDPVVPDERPVYQPTEPKSDTPPENTTVHSGEEKCFLPAVAGACEDYLIRWFYNADEGICNQFVYRGCSGNENNFNSEDECEKNCFHVHSTCQLPPLYGNCNESQIRWHYDDESKRCHEFEFSGCRGNRNNFFTEQECTDYCENIQPEEELSPTEGYSQIGHQCDLPPEAGNCTDRIIAWFYNGNSKQCEEFEYTGCNGNDNRFETLELCEKQCGKINGTDICLLPPEIGKCKNPTASERRWYYDDSRGTCVPFIYSGCSGNKNNFRSPSSCDNFCTNKTVKEADISSRFNEEKTPDCRSNEEKCRTLQCPFGKKIDQGADGCRQCKCLDPCRDYSCQTGEKCAVDVSSDPSLGSSFVPICREINKPGECPKLSNNSQCRRECYDDADCRDESKCCDNGCNHVCVRPQQTHLPTTTISPTSPKTDATHPSDIAATLEPKKPEEVEVTSSLGGVAVLRCFATGNPAPIVTWKRGKVEINTNKGRYVLTSTGDLTIVQVHQSDSGSYVCVASNGLGSPVSREVKLQVSDVKKNTPAYIIGPKNYTQIVTLKRPAVLRCPAGGYPNPLVHWWRGKKRMPLTTARYEIIRDFSLVIHSIELSDLGPYECSAYSGSGKAASITIVLKVVGPVHERNENDRPFLKYVLDPTVSPTSPKPTYSIQSSRPPVIGLGQKPGGDENVTSRPYKKQAKVNAVIRRDTSNNYTLGSDVVLICEVGGYPTPNVTWSKDSKPLFPSNRIQITENPYKLVIYGVTVEDSGYYVCTAKNTFSYNISGEKILIKSGVYVAPDCMDNKHFANCALIVKGKYCTNPYYAKFCCRSCTLAGQIPGGHPNFL